MTDLNRRNLIRSTVLAAGTLGVSFSTLANSCDITATQPEGPFFPENDQKDKDNDLTQVAGSRRLALGEVVLIKGVVKNQDCKPIKGALVEIWQACESGKYNHSGDPNNAALDPNFQYWGRAITNERGKYIFKTIKPGEYQATSTWVRPPHIHMKVHLRGHQELITQVYFKENKRLNDLDRLLNSVSPKEREHLTVDFKKNAAGHRVGTFNITLNAL